MTSSFTLRSTRGTWRHRASLCVAGVALMALDWLWWCAWVPVDAAVAAAVGVARVALGDIELHFAGVTLGDIVALGDIELHFAWQAWHLWHWTSSGGTQNSSTQLCHRCLSHTTLSHTTLLRTKTYTHTQNTVTHSSFTPPVLHHLLSFLPFPSHFHICL